MTGEGENGRILVVDDDDHIRELCRLYLEKAGFAVTEAHSGPGALKALEGEAVDLVVLDWMLPELDGFSVLHRIRQREQWLPVVMLTARGREDDRIAGLEQGADDYLTKPFSPREMVARVRAVLRRTHISAASDDEVIRHPGLVLDLGRRTAVAGGQPLTLTPREFDLLWFLAQHPHQVLTRDILLDRVWGMDYEGDGRTVDVHVTRLRQKLLKSPALYEYLETVWGQGYRFRPHERSLS